MNIQKTQLNENPQMGQLSQNKGLLTVVPSQLIQQPNVNLPINYANSSTTHPATTTVSMSATNTIASVSNANMSSDEKEKILMSGIGMLNDAEYTDEYLSVFGGSNAVSNPPGHIDDPIQTQQTKLGILFQTRQLEDKVKFKRINRILVRVTTNNGFLYFQRCNRLLLSWMKSN